MHIWLFLVIVNTYVLIFQILHILFPLGLLCLPFPILIVPIKIPATFKNATKHNIALFWDLILQPPVIYGLQLLLTTHCNAV